MRRGRWMRYAAAVLGGVLLSLAFPNVGVAGLAWVAPAIILFSGLGASGVVAFRCGFFGGFAFFLASLSWLLAIPYTWHGAPLAPGLGWMALSAYCALYMAIWVWFCWRIFPATAPLAASSPGGWAARFLEANVIGRMGWAFQCACGWVALELCRCWFLSGFPWNPLGASQYRMLPLLQIASFTGVYGVSFLTVWTSIALGTLALRLWRRPASRESVWTSAGPPLLIVMVIVAMGASQTAVLRLPQRSLKVALVQPSFPQTLIWDPEGDAVRFHNILALSRQALVGGPDLLVWPESGAPDMTPENQTTLGRLLEGHKTWMVLCVDSSAEGVDGATAVYNSSILMDPEGRVEGIYHKRRLVMFGEYIPFVRWLPFLKWLAPIGGGFSPGEEAVQFQMSQPRAKMSVLICFEDVFASEAREHVEAGTDFLINLTNDGWFGDGAAQWQQTACAVFRAIENGVPLLRCSNNGITCWIDAQGRLRNVLGWPDHVYSPGVLTIQVPLEDEKSRRPTFYNLHGDCFGLGCVVVAVAGVGFTFRRRA